MRTAFRKAFPALCAAVLALLVFMPAAGFRAASAASARDWTSGANNIAVHTANTVRLTDPQCDGSGGIDRTYLRASYNFTVDLREGREFGYYLPDDGSLSVGDEVAVFENPLGSTIPDKGKIMDDGRRFDHSYVRFTAKNAVGEGFEATFYHQRPDTDRVNAYRIEVNLSYIDPALMTGRRYVETLYSYTNNFGVWHTLSCYRFNGMYYISADGSCFVPVGDFSGMDLSAAAVTVETKSIETPAPKLILKSPTPNFKRHNFGSWTTLGESAVSREADGTYRVEMNERSDRLSSALIGDGDIKLRERIVCTQGFDVDEPIVLEISHDLTNSPASWWAFHLAPEPFAGAAPLVYGAGGLGDGKEAAPFVRTYQLERGAGFVDGLRGLYVTNALTGGAARMSDVSSNNPGTYQMRRDLDRIELRVGASNTQCWYNGGRIFDLNMKRADFAEGGYKAYPYFMANEFPADPRRANVFHVKGVNAPRNDGPVSVRYKDSDVSEPAFRLETYGQSPQFYANKELTVLFPPQHYTFENGVLTVKKSFFADKSFNLYEIFASTRGGAEYLKIRYADQSAPSGAPEQIGGAAFFVRGSEDNLSFYMEMKNMTFIRIYGEGIVEDWYTYNPTAKRVVIRNEFVSRFDYGEHEMMLMSEDLDGLTYETKITVKVVKSAPARIWVPGTPAPPVGRQPLFLGLVIPGAVLTAAGGTLLTVFLVRRKIKRRGASQ